PRTAPQTATTEAAALAVAAPRSSNLTAAQTNKGKRTYGNSKGYLAVEREGENTARLAKMSAPASSVASTIRRGVSLDLRALAHVRKRGATTRSPSISPIHHALHVSKNRGVDTMPARARLVTPTVALISVLKVAAGTISPNT